jgi:plastocyanin
MDSRSSKNMWLWFLALHVILSPFMIAQQPQSAVRNRGRSLSDIHGRITITGKGDSHAGHAREPIPGRYANPGGRDATSMFKPEGTEPSTLSEKTVVYLEGNELNLATYPLPEQNPLLDQKNLQFHPQVLPILVGTTVDFPNRDNLFHNVFSYSQAKEFDLGRYPRDDSRSVTFDRPGAVRVYCDIHSHMNAIILVLQHPYFSAPDDDGTYVIRHVPEGKYMLVLWYGRDVVERRPVEIKAGESIEVNFTF